jgi:hypothetical protein
VHKGLKTGTGVAASVLLAAALFVFYTFDPAAQAFFPKCPFLLVSGYECPGCGSQRAIHSLLHLRIGAALRYNALMLPALPYIFLGVYIEYFGGKKRFPGVERFFFGRWSAVVLLCVIIAYWILRNLL